MQSSVLSVFIVLIVVALTSARPDEKYTTKYNNINLDEILHSDRLLRAYVNCLLGKGKCTPDGEQLKGILPEALGNNCAKCDQTQRDGTLKVLHYLIDNKRDWFDELAAQYDPEGKYIKQYQEEIKKENLKL